MELHPQVRTLIDRIAETGARPAWQGTVADARARVAGIASLVGTGPVMSDEQDFVVPVTGGAVPARLYQPAGRPAAVLTVFLHGGGWTVGELEDFDGLCRRLATAAACDVLSVGYRLAPEHRHPVQVHDVDAALAWAAREVADGRPIVLAGESAGANLAAVVALHERDAGHNRVALQVLVCPVLDADPTTESYAVYGDTGYSLGTRDMAWYWDHYCPDVAARRHPDVAPLRAGSLRDLVPAFIVVAEQDVLRDDALRYAERLRSAGVPVEVQIFDDVLHGFFSLAGHLERGDEAVTAVAGAIRSVQAGN